jgi:hypothetical protein
MSDVLNPVKKTMVDIEEVCILYVVPPTSKETFELPPVDGRAGTKYGLEWTNVLVIADVTAGMIPDFPFLCVRNTNKKKWTTRALVTLLVRILVLKLVLEH